MNPEYPGFMSAQELNQSLNARVIGEIPWTPSIPPRTEGNDGLCLQNPFIAPPPALLTAIENLRRALDLSANRATEKVIQLTSTISGEGKSTLSMLLAASAANAGLNTLLVDTSIRWPKLSQTLNMHNGPGLAELLDGVPTVQQIQLSLRHCDLLKVKFLPAGRRTKHPVDVLGSANLGPIVDSLRSEFNCIVIDSPPVDFLVDGIIVSQFSDRLLYVVRQGFPPQEHVCAAIRRLSFYKALSGVVLNQIRAQPPLGTLA